TISGGRNLKSRARVVAMVLAGAAMSASSVAMAKNNKPGDTSVPAATPTQNQFFDWTVGATPTPPANYVPSPFLTDANATSVNAFLASLAPGAVRAVKVEAPISNATASLIFNNPSYHVSYVFGDLEGPNAVANAGTLVQQVRQVGTKTPT